MDLMLVSTLSAPLLQLNSLSGQRSLQNEASFFWASKQSCAGGCGSHGAGADTGGSGPGWPRAGIERRKRERKKGKKLSFGSDKPAA